MTTVIFLGVSASGLGAPVAGEFLGDTTGRIVLRDRLDAAQGGESTRRHTAPSVKAVPQMVRPLTIGSRALKDKTMIEFKNVFKFPMWFTVSLLAAAAAGCGGGGDSVPPGSRVLTSAIPAVAQAPVDLRSAGTFTILSKTGITDVFASSIFGNVGTSPITGAALLLTCTEVTGKIVVVDAAGPLPCATNDATTLTAAIGDMEAAYLDAEGRTSPDFSELGAGEIGGLTLAPGLYKWGTNVTISTDVTLSGGPDDVWIFQVAGQLNEANGKRVTLAGGAQARNIFWQVAGSTTLGTTAHFEGVVLGKTLIAVNTGASANSRLLAQTAVTLQMNAITQPAN